MQCGNLLQLSIMHHKRTCQVLRIWNA